MVSQCANPTTRRILRFVASALAFLSPFVSSFGQAQPPLQITAPADGTVVHPGDTVTVTVTQAAGTSFRMVAIWGALGSDRYLGSPPYQFSVSIPTPISAGSYEIHAVGAIGPRQEAASPSIKLDVEPANPCAKISTDTYTKFDGGPYPIRLQVRCIFADGTKMEITHSSQIQYTSTNTSVATVSADGAITAVGPGNSTILVSFNGKNASVYVEVPQPTQ